MRRLATAAGLVPATVFLVASLSADLVAIFGRDPIGIWTVLPAGPVGGGGWLNDELSSTALLLLAIALVRAKRVGFWLALLALVGAFVVQGFVHHHPLAAALALVAATILVLTRQRYTVPAGSTETQIAITLLALAVVAVWIAAMLDGPASTEVPRALRMVGTWIDGGTIGRLRIATAVTAVLLFARVAFVGAAVLVLDPAADPATAVEQERARRVLRTLGRGSLFPYQLDPMVTAYADPDGTAALAFARAGRGTVMLGDPVGEGGAATALARRWIARSWGLDWLPVVYQASATFAAELGASGWHACRIGSEALVDPTTFDLGSPRLANVRHTVERSRKGGVRISSSWGDGEGSAGLDRSMVVQLVRLDAEWRRGAGPRLGFTVGQFEPERLDGALVVVATGSDPGPVAFVVLRPTGADGGWMLDLMRRRKGAPPGSTEAALVHAIQLLADRGVVRLSLGLAPLAGLDPASGPIAERLLALTGRLIRPIYGVAGLAFFKDKFAPTWEPRYLVVPHRWTLVTAAIALLRLHLGGSWARIIRSLVPPDAASTPRPA